MKLKKSHNLMALIGASLLSASSAYSATINVNILRSNGTEGATTNPGYGLWGQGANTWNRIRGNTTSATNLVDSTGAATTVGYAFTGWTGNNSATGWGVDDLTQSGAFGPNDNTTTHTLTINNLTMGQAYELLFYFADAHPNETMTAQGESPDSFTESKITTGGNTYVEGSSGFFSYFDDVVANGSGEILVTASGANIETITGFQLRAIPEPSAALLGGLGLLALLRRRR